jgi:hypothetical protein
MPDGIAERVDAFLAARPMPDSRFTNAEIFARLTDAFVAWKYATYERLLAEQVIHRKASVMQRVTVETYGPIKETAYENPLSAG